MLEEDKKLLLHFVTYTGMYIQIVDKMNIVSFISGYEIGRKIDFSEDLSLYLQKEHKIEKLSTGWPSQIDSYSDKMSLDWVTAFKQITLALIDADVNGVQEKKQT